MIESIICLTGIEKVDVTKPRIGVFKKRLYKTKERNNICHG